MHFPKDKTSNTTAFDGPVVDGSLVRIENSTSYKCIHHAGSIQHAGGTQAVQLSALPLEPRPAHIIITRDLPSKYVHQFSHESNLLCVFLFIKR